MQPKRQKAGLFLVVTVFAWACGDEDLPDAAPADVGFARDTGTDAGTIIRDGSTSADAEPIDTGPTCTSTTIPPSAPDVIVTPPYTYELRRPTGPSPIGTRIVYLVDPARLEVGTPAPDDARQLVIQVFYPTDVTSGPPAPLMEPELGADLVRQGLPPGFNEHLLTHAIFDVPMAALARALPIVVYTHGLGGLRFENQPLLEELASRGYFVVSISVVHSSGTVVLEDGTVALTNVPPFPRRPDQQVAFMQGLRERMSRDWRPDISFVLDELGRWNEDPCAWVGGRLDLSRVVLTGFSFGGATSIEQCLDDARCDGAVNFDGNLFSNAAPMPDKPILEIHADRPDLTWFRTSQSLTGDVWAIRTRGNTHGNHSIFGSLVKGLLPNLDLEALGYGPIDPDRGLEIVYQYTVAFIEQVVKGQPQALLVGPSATFPEVFYEDAMGGAWTDPFSMFGNVFLGGNPATPVVGATITSLSGSTSTTTDSRGRYRLDGVVDAALVGALIEHPSIYPAVISAEGRGRNLPELPIGFESSAQVAAWAASAGVTLEPDKGHVAIVAGRIVDEQDVFAQSEVRLTSTSTDARTYYLGLGVGRPLDPNLQATTGQGVAFVFNVEPGTWTGTVAHAGLTCYARPAGPPEVPGRVEAIVVAGAMSARALGCE